jgi:hypothetical protein
MQIELVTLEHNKFRFFESMQVELVTLEHNKFRFFLKYAS